MAHGNCESMRSRAFTKGRAAFDSDDEYRRALNGEFDDVREDFSYEANEDPDDGEDAGDLEDLSDEEAVKVELEDLEDRIGEPKFLEILEKFMQKCSGCGEPPYLPFRPVHGVEHLAVFCAGTEALRLRYGAYGFEADRLEGDEVVKTWKGLSAVEVLNDWDDDLAELAEEAEDAEEGAKDRFFDDTLPGILADRRRGAAFLGFVMDAVNGRLGDRVFLVDGVENSPWWLRWAGKTFVLREGTARDVASWGEEEFLERLRETAWDDAGARESMLAGGDVEDAWDALDDAWYDEEDDGSVEEAVGRFLDRVKSCRGNGSVREDVDVVGGSGYGEAGRVDMTLVWSGVAPDLAQLTVRTWLATGDKDEDTYDVPLAFLRWWAFGKDRGW